MHVEKRRLLVAVGCGIACFLMVKLMHHDPVPGVYDAESAYKQMLPDVDPERRTAKLTNDGKALDFSAFSGMPDDYRRLVRDYLESVFNSLNASPLMRERYYHVDRSQSRFGARFPDDVNPQWDGEIPISLAVLPRPEVVRNWTHSQPALKAGWRAMADAIRDPGSVHGHTLIFEAGQQSEEHLALPAAPMGMLIPSWSEYVQGLYLGDRGPFFLPLGKIVLQPFFHGPGGQTEDGSTPLGLGKPGGAKLLGELLTVPAHLKNERLRWVSRKAGSETDEFLAYSLVDGNGAHRASAKSRYQMSDLGDVSPYLRPLTCKQHQPRINQHDLLLLPVPIAWPTRLGEMPAQHPHEEWCFDDWFPAQQTACWVIRETADSKPLQESFLLMPAEEPSDRPIFFAAVFAETEPERLVKELSALYQVPPDKVLESTETMARLQNLYDQLSTFDMSP